MNHKALVSLEMFINYVMLVLLGCFAMLFSRITMIYYVLEAVFCLYTFFKYPPQKDRNQYIIHHIAMLFLMGWSYQNGMTQQGVVILLIHDVSDVFLHLSKFFHYMKYENMTNISFVLFMVSFFFLRLVIYPSYLYLLYVRFYRILRIPFPFLLTLQFLHIYWFGLICRIAYIAILKKGVQGDIRENSENDSDNLE